MESLYFEAPLFESEVLRYYNYSTFLTMYYYYYYYYHHHHHY